VIRARAASTTSPPAFTRSACAVASPGAHQMPFAARIASVSPFSLQFQCR
jgi:hypothetical protein